jgi:serine/threonine-protein kinase 19
VPSDTKAALQVLHKENYIFDVYITTKHVLPPIILKTQLYSMVKNRTITDKELDDLKRSNEIKVLKILTGNEDYICVFTTDYISHLRSVTQQHMNRNKENNPGDKDFKIVEDFITKFLPNHSDVSVSKERLEKLLYGEGKQIAEKDLTYVTSLLFVLISIRTLIAIGALLLRDVNTYWISVPNIGIFVKSIIQGRKEVVSLLKRQKWNEMLLKDLIKKKLRYSNLDMSFHIKDMIGKDMLQRYNNIVLLYLISSTVLPQLLVI